MTAPKFTLRAGPSGPVIQAAPGYVLVSLGPGLGVTFVPASSILPSAGSAGPMGPPGADGDDGMQGPPGAPGAPGSAGAAGSMGARGWDGDDGDDGMIGPPGAAGTAGAAGAPGAPGAAGAAGSMGPPGLDGDDGDDGMIGPPGPAGAAGPPAPVTGDENISVQVSGTGAVGVTLIDLDRRFRSLLRSYVDTIGVIPDGLETDFQRSYDEVG